MTRGTRWLQRLRKFRGTLRTLVGDGMQLARLCLRSPAALAAENRWLRQPHRPR